MSPRHLPTLLLASLLPVPAAAVTLVNERAPAPAPLFTDALAEPIYNNFGGVGLITTPTARFAPDGEAAFFFSEGDPYRQFGVGMQFLPRLEASAHYTLVKTVPLANGNDYVDKGIDLKYRLLDEGGWWPQLAIGLRDIAGTGLFASEYVVASKRQGDFDWHLGLATGNLGARGLLRNPLCSAADRFCQRSTGFAGTGGKVEFDKFFAGPVSPFAGLTWQTPWQPLRLLFELDGNHYRNELVAGDLKADSPFNVGAVVKLSPAVDLRVAGERGNTLSFTVSFRGNLHRMSQPKVRQATTAWGAPGRQAEDMPVLAERLEREAGYRVSAAHRDGDRLDVIAEQQRYRDLSAARTQAWKVLQAGVPDEVKTFSLTESGQGVSLVRHEVARARLSEAFTPSDEQPALADVVRQSEPSPLTGEALPLAPAPVWRASLGPYLQQSFGGVDTFYAYDIGARASLSLRKGANELQGSLLASAINNYDGFRSNPAFTSLPTVRTRIREYVDRPLRLESLQLTRHAQPLPGLLAAGYGGVLELMFSGVGGELLWRPREQGWGLGVDVNAVRQRDPGNEFGLLPYQVVTGHVTAYVPVPRWYNLLAKVSAGRYLAGDTGMTFDVSRGFDSGLRVGAYAAFTNVSAAEYGEGSFNKGIYLNIPLDLLSFRNTRATGGFNWNPIQRDGGQMLNRKVSLWQLSESVRP